MRFCNGVMIKKLDPLGMPQNGCNLTVVLSWLTKVLEFRSLREAHLS
jgi:hypothetical protein